METTLVKENPHRVSYIPISPTIDQNQIHVVF